MPRLCSTVVESNATEIATRSARAPAASAERRLAPSSEWPRAAMGSAAMGSGATGGMAATGAITAALPSALPDPDVVDDEPRPQHLRPRRTRPAAADGEVREHVRGPGVVPVRVHPAELAIDHERAVHAVPHAPRRPLHREHVERGAVVAAGCVGVGGVQPREDGPFAFVEA